MLDSNSTVGFEQTPPQVKPLRLTVDRATRNVVVAIFILLLIGFLYLASSVLLPVVLAFLFALVLGPVARALRRRGIPGGAAAAGLVVILFVVLASSAYLLSGPITTLITEAPRMTAEIQGKLRILQRPLQGLTNATAQFQKLTASTDSSQRVVVEGPSQIGAVASGAGHTIAQIGLCLVLLLFTLAAGDLFSEKLINVMPTLSDKKRALGIAREIEHEVSRYLATIGVINVAVGVAVGLALWALGMPSPVLWGVLAAMLNFLPYVGAAIGVAVTFGVAIVAFDTLGQAALVPAAYILIATLEGQFITPMILGRRLEMNNVVILISIAFWGWLWGIVGALIAVPLLVTAKVFVDHIDGLGGVGEFLGGKSASVAAHRDSEGEAAPPR